MELKEACKFLSDLSGIPFAIIAEKKQLEAFCKRNFFHKSQDLFVSSNLQEFISGLDDKTIYFIEDLLLISFVIIKDKDILILIGPYTTSDMTHANMQLLKQSYGLNDLDIREYTSYRYAYLYQEEETVFRGCQVLLKNCGRNFDAYKSLHERVTQQAVSRGWQYEKKHFENIVNERYAVEQEMMEQIAEGDDAGAVANYRKLHNNIRYMTNFSGTPYASRISAGITRSTVRIAAFNAGLPPVLIDDISGESSHKINELNSREEMYRENEKMIRDFARAIHRFRENRYSTLVFNAIMLFERFYNKELNIESTAERLGVSVSTLTKSFKKETGITPKAYLTDYRIRRAMRLLRTSQNSIQQIAEEVGIPDSNYFVKVFKKATDTTPSAYRRYYHEKKR